MWLGTCAGVTGNGGPAHGRHGCGSAGTGTHKLKTMLVPLHEDVARPRLACLGRPSPPIPHCPQSQEPPRLGRSSEASEQRWGGGQPTGPLLSGLGEGQLNPMGLHGPISSSDQSCGCDHKMGQDFPGTQTLPAAGAAPRGQREAQESRPAPQTPSSLHSSPSHWPGSM